MTEYTRYDSDANLTIRGFRLIKDPRVVDGARGKMVSITAVMTSRLDTDHDMFIEAQVTDFHANKCAYLKKGDTLHAVTGFLTMRRYGDEQEKVAFNLRRAVPSIPTAMFAVLKERGWDPKAGTGEGKPAGKPKAKPAGAKPSKPKQVVQLPDDEDDEVTVTDDEE